MANVDTKIEAVQQWLTALLQTPAADYAALELVLTDVLAVIDQAEPRLASAAALIATNAALQSQIEALSKQLHEHVTEISRLNVLLQAQIQANNHALAAEREQRILMEALRDTIATMSNTLDLDKVLEHILDTVGRVTPYDGANVLFVESDLVHVVSQRGYVEKDEEKAWLQQRIPIAKLAALQQLIDIGLPVAIPDTTTSPLWIGFPGQDWIHSNVIALIRLKDEILGFLSLDSATPGFFTQAHAERLQAFADQAAIAIQNSRLYDRAKRAAVIEERTRLTNELHDTISQTLWSVSLITE